MMLIVTSHYVANSGLSEPIFANQTSLRSLFLLLVGSWGKVGINCFVLITGYFMCKSNITLRKYLKLVLEVELYNILIYFVFIISGYSEFSLSGFVEAVIPIIKTQEFTSSYLVFYLFIPFLNILVAHMSERQHISLILLSVFILSIIGLIPKAVVPMNYVVWFMVLYMIASYIRMYPRKIFQSAKVWGITTTILFLISAFSIVICTFVAEHLNKTGFRYPNWFIADSNKILALALSVSAFIFFKNIRIKYNKFINTVAASTFGVLMIHANSDTMRQWLWRDVLHNVDMYNSPYLLLHIACSVIAVYVICTLIDFARIQLLEKPFFRLWDKHWDRIGAAINRLTEKFWKRIGVPKATDYK